MISIHRREMKWWPPFFLYTERSHAMNLYLVETIYIFKLLIVTLFSFSTFSGKSVVLHGVCCSSSLYSLYSWRDVILAFFELSIFIFCCMTRLRVSMSFPLSDCIFAHSSFVYRQFCVVLILRYGHCDMSLLRVSPLCSHILKWVFFHISIIYSRFG